MRNLKTNSLTGICWFMLAFILLSSCSVTRKMESGEYLLIKNKIKISNRSILTEEVEPYIQQKPNTKLIGLFRTNIALYNWGMKGKESKFKKWLRTKAGQEPVVLDTSLNAVSIKQMNLYLSNKGYFHSNISDTIIYKKKKAIVQYRIITPKPYLIRSLVYAIADTQLARFVYKDTSKCLIRRGSNFDSYILDDERTRITNNLKNHGFFRFSNIYIKYVVDTSFQKYQCDITLEIVNRVMPSFDNFTTIQQLPHKRYFINKIYIYPEFDHLVTYSGTYDTLVKSYQSSTRGQPPNTYYFLYQDQFRVKPRTIAQSIFITPKSNYNLLDVNQSYAQLNSLPVFKYINIQFREVGDGKESKPRNRDVVDCHVELSRAPAQSVSVTTDGTNSGGAFGVQGNLGYQNRNIFRGAQLLRLNLSGSLQMQATAGSSGNAFFNTFELGMNAGITFPQFLIPIRPETLPKSFKPKTTVSVGYNFQHQQHYDQHISNITFGYSWEQNETIKHVLNPVEISLVKVSTDAYFDSVLNNEQDNRLKNQYSDHMVAGLKYTFTFNNQKINKIKNFTYIRANFETGGNLIYLFNEMLKTNKRGADAYKLFGLPYAQYVRPDIDFRYYNLFPNKLSLVYRFYGGIGIPYGNASLLPFEKAFFSGGANGMRGWKMYSLGPGRYNNADASATFNQIGDIQLEANIEYRFPVYNWIRGAVFLDAGNIWVLQESQDLPGGQFTFPGFIDQIALDAGIGIRLDFDFFIFRFDPAIRLRVPSYPKNDRWYFNKMQVKDIIWNFGIGYPF
ncbi:MAG: BamA/TamA family outer membrane protein [Bacteroidales bacterium]|nr:BamA/TamA family outer membrane protein [Bacteroidales bacterium]